MVYFSVLTTIYPLVKFISRKNPTHFAGYCHPGDETYDEACDEAEEKLTSKKKLREKGRMAWMEMYVWGEY